MNLYQNARHRVSDMHRSIPTPPYLLKRGDWSQKDLYFGRVMTAAVVNDLLPVSYPSGSERDLYHNLEGIHHHLIRGDDGPGVQLTILLLLLFHPPRA
jgi:hypothetical protein